MKLLNRVIRELDRGASIEEIKANFGISKKSLARCQKEVEIRNDIKRLMQEGNLIEAKMQANRIDTEIIDTETLLILQELAVKTQNTEKEKELLGMIGKRQLNNSQKRKMLYDSLRYEPENLKNISELIRILYRIGEKEEAKRLESVARNVRKKKIEAEAKEIEVKEETKTPFEIAREIIYQEKDVLKSAEEIESILRGEDEQKRALVLAEFFAHTGFKKRAEDILNAHKKTLDIETEREAIKIINQALALVKNAKTQHFNWTHFWEEKAKTLEAQPEEETR